MKRKLAIFGIALIFIAGIAVMSYPLFSSVVNNLASRSSAQEYTKTTELLAPKENEAMLKAAQTYNQSLTNNVILTDPFDKEAYEKIGGNYEKALDVDGKGLIGYIDVPKINVYLPVRHGTSEEVLSRSAGHLQNTSMPVGGENTHAVISAHTGFPGETFFDYLTELKEGDEFYVHVLNKTLKYEVDQIKVTLPDNTSDLRIISGGDYVTLLTCTPYGVNTHRLLVRGKRVEFDDSQYVTASAKAVNFGESGIFLLGYKIPYWAAGAALAGFAALVVILVAVIIKRANKKEKLAGLKEESGDVA